MLAWFLAQNKFWLIERIVHSIVLAPLLYAFYMAQQKIKTHANVLTAHETWYLAASMLHIGIQLTHYFVYSSAILYYAASTVLFIQIVCLNDMFVPHMADLPDQLRTYIEQGCKYAIIFLLIYGVYEVLQINSPNQCGQNLMYITIPLYFVIAGFTAAELLYILKKKNDEMAGIIDVRLSALAGQTDADANARSRSLNSIKKQKVFFSHLLYVIVVGYVLNSALYYKKLKKVHAKTVKCVDLFADKNVVFLTLFSVLEVCGANALNVFVFYYYYWVRKYEFSLDMSRASYSEAFEGFRSMLLTEPPKHHDMV